MAVLKWRDPATGNYLPVSYGGADDGVRDTGYVPNAGWTDVPGHKTAGAFKQGRMVTIHGTVVNDGLEVLDYDSYLVGTVSVEFRPTASFTFPIMWSDAAINGPHPGWGYINSSGQIYVIDPVTFSMDANDAVYINATYTLD